MRLLSRSWRAALHRKSTCCFYSASKSCQVHASTPKENGALECHNVGSSLSKRGLTAITGDPFESAMLRTDSDWCLFRTFRGLCTGAQVSLATADIESPCGSEDGIDRVDLQKAQNHDADDKQGVVDELKKSGQKISERHNLAMIFTCTVCQTRSAKTMSRQTYEKGVVIVRCGGCKNLHLIADRLGWFGEPGSVEEFLKQKGVEVRKGTEESYEFTLEDLTGWSPPGKKN